MANLSNPEGRPDISRWGAVASLSLLSFLLVAMEFMPASLLTPIARDLAISEGLAGLSIATSGGFAVVASLFGNALMARLDRKTIVLLYTGAFAGSGLVIGLAPTFPIFLAGRALIGLAIGGYWSLSTALAVRLVRAADAAKAIALLQVGTAAALVVAAPIGSFLGARIGWRPTFGVTAPLGLLVLIAQGCVLPNMPAVEEISPTRALRLFQNPAFGAAMLAIALSFAGQNAFTTYLRPFLEAVSGFHGDGVPLALLILGAGGLAGLGYVGRAIRSGPQVVLIWSPLILAILAVFIVATANLAVEISAALLLWGFCSTPIIVAWNTWLADVIPNDLEAGGGLQVAVIQCAIAAGASAGGRLFDAAGWWTAFLLAAALLLGSSLSARTAMQRATHPTYSPLQGESRV